MYVQRPKKMDDDDLVVVIVDEEKGQQKNVEEVVFEGSSLDHRSLLDALQKHSPKVLKQVQVNDEEYIEPQMDVEVKVENDYFIDENLDTEETLLSEDLFEEYLDESDEDIKSEDGHVPEETVLVKQDTQDRRKRPYHRYALRKSDEQESYVKKLKELYPMLRKDQALLIDTLVDKMKEVTPPKLPKIVFIEGDDSSLRYNCVKCHHKSATVPAARRHYQETHGERYLVCFACGVDFRSTTTLYRHELRCIAPDATVVLKARALFVGGKARSRPYISPFHVIARNKSLKERQKLYMHRKKFVCHLCPAVFRCKVSLVSHVHSHVGLRPYRCSTCGAAYTSMPGLKKHVLRHGSPQFTCDYCSSQFYTKSALTQHILSHLSVRRFACGECPSRYTQKKALVAHVRAVHHRLPLPCVCQLCGKRFPYMTSLKVHMHHAHKMTMMTRHMFFKKLPTMPEADVVEYARIVLNTNDKEHARMREQQSQEGNDMLQWTEDVKYVVNDNVIELDDSDEDVDLNSDNQSNKDTIEFSKMMIWNMKQKLANQLQKQTYPLNENTDSIFKKEERLYVAPKTKPKTSSVKDVNKEFDIESIDKLMYSKYMETIQRVKNYHKMQLINALSEETEVKDGMSTEEKAADTENTLKIEPKEDEKGTVIQTLPQMTINKSTDTSIKETNFNTETLEESQTKIGIELQPPVHNTRYAKHRASSGHGAVIKLVENKTTSKIEFVQPDTQNAKQGTSSDQVVKPENYIDKGVKFVKPVKTGYNTRYSKRNISNCEDGVIKLLKDRSTKAIKFVKPVKMTNNTRNAKRETTSDQEGALKLLEDQIKNGRVIEPIADPPSALGSITLPLSLPPSTENIENIPSTKKMHNIRKTKRDTSSDQDIIVIKSADDQTKDGVVKSVEDQTKDEVIKSVEDQTKDEVIKSVEDQTKDEVIKSVEDQTKDEVIKSVEDQTKDEVIKSVEDQTKDEVIISVEDQTKDGVVQSVEDQTKDGVVQSVEDQTKDEVIKSVEDQIKDGVVQSVEDQTKDEVIKSVEDQIKDGVVQSVEDQTKDEVIKSVEDQTKDGVVQSVEDQTKDEVIKSVEDQTKDKVVKPVKDQPIDIVPPAKKINTRNAKRRNSGDLDEFKKTLEKHTNVEAEVDPSVKMIHNTRNTNRHSRNHDDKVSDITPANNNTEEVKTDLAVKNSLNARNSKRTASNASLHENDVTMKTVEDRNDVSVSKRGKKDLHDSKTDTSSEKGDANDEMPMEDGSKVESRNLESNYCKTRSKRNKGRVIEKNGN